MYELDNFTVENGYVDAIFLLGNDRPEEYLAAFDAVGGIVKYDFHLIDAVNARVPVDKLDDLAALSYIRKIENNGEVRVPPVDDDIPDDGTNAPNDWNLDNIHAKEAWDAGYTGKGVKVAVIDTGIDYKHSDLAGNYKGGYNFVADNDDAWDDQGHGTHCAGVIGGNGKIKGVAPDVDLYGVKVLNSWGSGTYADVIAGIEWAVDNEMDIGSMSLGGSSGTEALELACQRAYEEGTILVAAAGNSGGSIGYPSKYESCITVGAVDKDNELAYFSSRGPEMDVVAPGVDVYSTYPGEDYTEMSGTSMATPHVAGAVAVLLGKETLDFDAVRVKLHETSDLLGREGFTEEYGYGLINVKDLLGV